jgi:GNAT superfamily N-acetyltransferase
LLVGVKVREARPDDAGAVAALLGELGYPSTAAEVGRRLSIWLDEPYSRVLLATSDATSDPAGKTGSGAAGDSGRVVGSMSVHAIPHLERDGRWLRIESLVVAAGVRGSGAGRRLVEAAEKVARSWDCHAIEVTSSRHREGAHAFYKRLGFADICHRSGRFWKDL